MLSEKERTVLLAVEKNKLITKSDLKKTVGDGAEYTINKLIEKKLVSEVRPIGPICYVTTAKGTKALHEI